MVVSWAVVPVMLPFGGVAGVAVLPGVACLVYRMLVLPLLGVGLVLLVRGGGCGLVVC